MQYYIEERVKKIACYIIENNATVRAAGAAFEVSKSTVHTDMTVRLRDIDAELYDKVRRVLDYNFSVRHIRGGQSTHDKYLGTDN